MQIDTNSALSTDALQLCIMASLCIILVCFTLVNSALSAKIAGFSFVSSGSHYFVIRNTLEELASRGHEVKTSVFHLTIYIVKF